MTYIIFNHLLCPTKDFSLAVNDRGFLLGDGIFETLRSDPGLISNLALHWQRLQHSAKILNLALPLTQTELSAHIIKLLTSNNLIEKVAVLRLTVTRGSGDRGLVPAPDLKPNFLLTAQAWEPPQKSYFSAQISTIRRNEFSPLSSIKSLNYLDNILAKQQAVKNGYDEAIFLNTQGNLACATTANLFLIKNEKIFTPALEQGTLPGIIRQIILEQTQIENIEVMATTLSLSDLYQADAVFITNSLIKIMPINRVNQHNFQSSNHALLLKLINTPYVEQPDGQL